MKVQWLMLVMVSAVGSAGLISLLAGCEASSAADPITITPSSITLTYGQSQEFVASGGYSYKWTLSNTQIGTLNPPTGPRVVYTYTGVVSSGMVQTITANGFIPGASAGTGGTGISNTTPLTVSATAVVIHL